MSDLDSKREVSESTATMLAEVAQNEVMAAWPEERRVAFVQTFHDRLRVSQYLALEVAKRVRDGAKVRRFVSDKHVRNLDVPLMSDQYFDRRVPGDRYSGFAGVGKRAFADLDAIAEERAAAILSELPALKQAVQIVAPDVAKWISDRDKLLEKGEALKEEVDKLSEPIDMDDHPKMLVEDFQAMVRDRIKARRRIVLKMDEIGREGCALEDRINKRLYAGLPGLSDAVVKVVTDLVDRYRAMDGMGRRVEEQVRFGDSEAALEILRGFERDEVAVGDGVRAEFAAAMEKLRGAAKAVRGKAAGKSAKKLGA